MSRLGHGWRIVSLVAACILALSVAASATTYYIDYAAGSDSNNGTSTATPWQHLPGMANCASGTACTYKPVAGDQFILRGGVTWPNAAFPILWSWSGTNGNNIYIGVNNTWYTGSSWTRPIFDAQSQVIAGSWNMFFHCVYSGVQYVTLDNIEMTGLTWNGSATYGHLGYITTNTASNILLENLYLHGWTHTGSSSSNSSTCTGTCDDLKLILGDTNSPYDAGSLLTNSVIDGSDSTNGGDSGGATYAWPSATYNIIHNATNGLLLEGHGEVGNNLIYNINQSFDASMHENAIEVIHSDGGIFYIHDNIIHDNYGESIFMGGTTAGEIDYLWNNVLYNLANSNPMHIDARQYAWTGYYLNNTIVPQSGQQCFIQVGTTASVVLTLANNHCISATGLDNITSPVTVTRTTNLTQTPTVASRQGYTSTGNYAYTPLLSCTPATCSTLQAGTNLILASIWPSGYSVKDTSYACSQSATNQVVCPVRGVGISSPRPATWDVGSYVMWAPTGVAAVAH
jgi:hypothetical protein